jgi:hypothetical protein
MPTQCICPVLYNTHTYCTTPQVSQGYDVLVSIVSARHLPAMDWWDGLADPYIIVTTNAGGQQMSYRCVCVCECVCVCVCVCVRARARVCVCVC